MLSYEYQPGRGILVGKAQRILMSLLSTLHNSLYFLNTSERVIGYACSFCLVFFFTAVDQSSASGVFTEAQDEIQMLNCSFSFDLIGSSGVYQAKQYVTHVPHGLLKDREAIAFPLPYNCRG